MTVSLFHIENDDLLIYEPQVQGRRNCENPVGLIHCTLLAKPHCPIDELCERE